MAVTSSHVVGEPWVQWCGFGRDEVSEEEFALSEVAVVPGEVMLAEIATLPASSALVLLEGIDPSSLDDPRSVLDYLRAAERIDALTAALKARARVALAGAEPSGALLEELHVEHELAVATRSSRYVAGVSIERARVLTTTFPAFLGALADGLITEAHCRALVEGTRSVTDPGALSAIGRLLLPKARRMTPGPFRREVAKAVADVDPDATARHRRAREQRSVWTRELEDGMSFLGLVHDTPTITAIRATLDTDAAALTAERGGRAAQLAGEEDAAVGACRADALAARVLGSTDETGAIDWTPIPADVHVQLVIDLETLRGEADRHCLLDGQPVPAAIGRDLAAYATTFRRMVTDPVTGHLLDYGRTTYLPAPLRTYVMARDGGCRIPGCTVRDPRRLQLDHAVPYPDGPSDPTNTGTLCVAHHQLKTAGLLRIDRTSPDGACSWTTPWGHRVRIPARPFLHDPADRPPPEPPPPDDPPPF